MSVETVLEEVKLMAKLRHECICSVLGASVINDELVWVVLEYITGGDLHVFLYKNLSLPLNSQVNFCLQAARAVNYLHSLTPPVLHRDIKSQNFLVADSTKLKLTDFGLSRVKSRAGYTQSTPNWTAPEILGRREQWSEKSDIYSLGMVFFEIISKEIPFHDVHDMDTAIINGARPTIPKDTPMVCKRSCNKLMCE